MSRLQIQTAFLGAYTLAALDAAPDAEAAWLIHALCAWILRDELPAKIPAKFASAWAIVRAESEAIHAAKKRDVDNGKNGGRPPKKPKETQTEPKETQSPETETQTNPTETKREIEIESKMENSRAIALEARAPACERIPESLAEEEAAFAEFWNIYPRRDYKNAARRAWGNLFGTLPPKPETLAAILAAVRRDRASDQWREDGGRYIPNAAKWLENRPWEARNDALPPPSPKSNVPAAPDYAADEKEREKRDLAAAAAALKRMTW